MWGRRPKREKKKKHFIPTDKRDILKARLYWIERQRDLEKDNLYERDRQAYWTKVIPEVEKAYQRMISSAEHSSTGVLSIPEAPEIEKKMKKLRTNQDVTRRKLEQEAEKAMKLYEEKRRKEGEGLLGRLGLKKKEQS